MKVLINFRLNHIVENIRSNHDTGKSCEDNDLLIGNPLTDGLVNFLRNIPLLKRYGSTKIKDMLLITGEFQCFG